MNKLNENMKRFGTKNLQEQRGTALNTAYSQQGFKMWMEQRQQYIFNFDGDFPDAIAKKNQEMPAKLISMKNGYYLEFIYTLPDGKELTKYVKLGSW